MTALHTALSNATARFSAHFSHPRGHAEELFCDLLNCSRAMLYVRLDEKLTAEQCTMSALWIERRLKGEPLAYIYGSVDFYGCKLQVNRAVLIPRQETELLVDRVVQQLMCEDLSNKVLCDLCCGSGCIGIALKKKLPALQVVLTDCSVEALAVAKHNAKHNQVEVCCLQGDLFDPLSGQKVDFVVCNPPYLSSMEYACAEREVREYEPVLALVGGETGLEFYEKLASKLPQYLHRGGRVWLEIGYQQGKALLTLFSASSWKRKQLEKDWAGHHRFFFLENE